VIKNYLELPCSRCVKLKLECSREYVRVRKNASKNATEIEFLKKLKLQLDVHSHDKATSVAAAEVDKRLLLLESGLDDSLKKDDSEARGKGPNLTDGIAELSERDISLRPSTADTFNNQEIPSSQIPQKDSETATMVTVLE
jgi:hypothetical protein